MRSLLRCIYASPAYGLMRSGFQISMRRLSDSKHLTSPDHIHSLDQNAVPMDKMTIQKALRVCDLGIAHSIPRRMEDTSSSSNSPQSYLIQAVRAHTHRTNRSPIRLNTSEDLNYGLRTMSGESGASYTRETFGQLLRATTGSASCPEL
jgi:hypothetical protein